MLQWGNCLFCSLFIVIWARKAAVSWVMMCSCASEYTHVKYTGIQSVHSCCTVWYLHLVYIQRGEEMGPNCLCTSGQEVQEMQVLNTRLLQLVEMLATERDNVVQLQKSRELLSAQIRDIKVLTQLFFFGKNNLPHSVKWSAGWNHLLSTSCLFDDTQLSSHPTYIIVTLWPSC